VDVTVLVDRYQYRTGVLWGAYGAALFAAIVANIIGLVAFHYNKARMDKSFSFTASATQHTDMLDEEHFGRRGSIPVPTEVKKKKLLFTELRDGGWGFIVIIDREEGQGGQGYGGIGREDGEERGEDRDH
jgi:hypothetical protein